MATHVYRINGMDLSAARAAASRNGTNIDDKFTAIETAFGTVATALTAIDTQLTQINSSVTALQGKTTEMTEAEVTDLVNALS